MVRPPPGVAAALFAALCLARPAAAAPAAPADPAAAANPDPTDVPPPVLHRTTGRAKTQTEEVVVTGSRLKRIGAARASPITAVSAAELKAQGSVRVEDLLNTLPQVNAGLNSGALGPTGTATVDLRGFGAFRTLVLMDGRRLNPGDPFNPSVDLNSVPASMIKRVDVLTGGASSIYGSDAIAGVVNFIMNSNFTGLKFDSQGTLFNYSNSDRALQSLARSSGTNPATGSTLDGGTADASVVYGTDFAGGRGHVVAYGEYVHTSAIAASSRDYAACNLIESGSYYACIKDQNTNPAFFQDPAGNALTLDRTTGSTLRPYVNADGYNTAPYQYLQRPDERFNAGLFAHYDVSTALQPYFETQFSNDTTTAQYEPAGTSLNSFNVNCNNPLLSASEVADFCTAAGLGPNDTTSLVIGQRNVQGSPRTLAFSHISYRAVLGAKGEIAPPWSYDVYGQYGITLASVRVRNDLSLTKVGNALNVVNVNGVPTCQSVVDGTDPACVPYNIFQVGGISQAAANYITQGGSQHGNAAQAVVSGALTGKLGEYGVKSPFATDGVGLVVGGEYRNESITNTPDASYVNGDFAVTSSQLPVAGTYSVYEFFGETTLPIVQDEPFAKSLSLDLSDRYARYSLQGPANANSIGGEWEPVEGLEFRGSQSRAIRAPNGHELFLANTISKFQGPDPCAGANPIATATQCAQSGVTAAQYGTIPDTGNFNFESGGNTGLRPETSHSFTIGAVIQPHIIPDFTMSVDYWKITVANYDGQYAPNSTLNNCVFTGNPVFCQLVLRDANGSLSLGNGLTAGRVIATNINTGTFEESGIDLTAGYRYRLEQLGLHTDGALTMRFNGSVALDNVIKPIKNSNTVVFDCTGLFGPSCTGNGPTSPIPTWRHQVRLTYSVPDRYEVSVNWRHIAHLNSELASNQAALAGTPSVVDSKIPAYDYMDLEGDIDFGERYNLRLGVSNVFDSKPPIVGSAANPQILPGNLVASFYDVLGRTVFFGVTLNY